MLSKYPYLDTGIDRKAAALESFRKAESVCLDTNRRMRKVREGREESLSPAVSAIISMAQRKISQVLGDVDFERISDGFGWGPGANIGVRGKHTSAYNKFSGPLDVTRNCLILSQCCINSKPSWANAVTNTGEIPSVPVSVLTDVFSIVKGNEIIFVPKNAKIERVIAVEPSMNSHIQKGIGAFIRRRLRERAGIDLNDQSINQSLAQYGSKTGELATIDLSMASDTIATELVRELLSEEWFMLLDSCRCKYGTIRSTKELVQFQKFSSMGNAYTFELESLIFYALSWASERYSRDIMNGSGAQLLSVYGDDLVVPVHCYDILLETLNFCGFSVNKEKSYATGPFRESCGKDFFLGTNVRPLFFKERIDNVEALYRCINSIRRYAHLRTSFAGCDKRFADCYYRMVDRVPKPFRLFQSEGYGDGAIIGNFDESVPSIPRDGWEGYTVRVINRRPFKAPFESESFGYTTVLMRAGSEIPAFGQYDQRNRTFPKMGQLLVRDWYNLGGWV
jgi:hypothetical protein